MWPAVSGAKVGVRRRGASVTAFPLAGVCLGLLHFNLVHITTRYLPHPVAAAEQASVRPGPGGKRSGTGAGRELLRLSCTRSHAFLHRPRTSGIGGGEGGGAADQFQAKMRMTRSRYPVPVFNKKVGLTGQDLAGVFEQAEWKQLASPNANPPGFFLR